MAAFQRVQEALHRFRRRGAQGPLVHVVQGDQIHMALQIPKQRGQFDGMLRAAVEPVDEGVLEDHPPPVFSHTPARRP